MADVIRLHPKTRPAAELRTAAQLGARLAADALRWNFIELAYRAAEKSHALATEAALAERYEAAEAERDELRGGAELVLALAARRGRK
jgi:hypothetical protein